MKKTTRHGTGSKRLAGQGGFTLIALAVIIAVLGILFTTLLPTKAGRFSDKLKITQDRLRAVNNAMQVYYMTSMEKYPCPAALDVAQSAPGFGNETSCKNVKTDPSHTCPAGVSCPSSAGDYAIIGTVPVRSLALGDEYMFDGWGNRFVYGVDLSRITGSGARILAVKDLGGTDLAIQPQYYLGSMGPDANGAYNFAGTHKTCTATGNLGDNCDGDRNFTADNWNKDATSGAVTFDDITGTPAPPCPVGIKGCTAWFDASDVNNDGAAPADIAALTTWKDKSNNQLDATQVSGGSKPSVHAGIIGSRAVVRFDGTDDNLNNMAYHAEGATTVIAVAKQLGGTGHQRIFAGYNDANIFLGSYNSNYTNLFGNGTSWNACCNENSPATSITTDYKVLAIVSDGASATPYIDGTAQTLIDSTGLGYTGFSIGGVYSGQSFNGDVAELVIYNRALSTGERGQIECYMARKYALVVSGC